MASARSSDQRQVPSFQQRKRTFLGKGDKSSAGGIDAHAREVCAVINERDDAFTTSSCSGRAFIWRGEGVKATERFSRYRVTHELISDGDAYFNLPSLSSDVVDGAWEDLQRTRQKPVAKETRRRMWMSTLADSLATYVPCVCDVSVSSGAADPVIWLRFEPFILHVCCRDLEAAGRLISAARQVFKNVGVQSWSQSKVMVSIWGDEGLDMALTDPSGRFLFRGQVEWLVEQVNSRHRRNWAKIDRFAQALLELPSDDDVAQPLLRESSLEGADEEEEEEEKEEGPRRRSRAVPRHFDVIGDVAVLSALPEGADRAQVGKPILKENAKIRIVALRAGCLEGHCRAPSGLQVLAGPERRPLITTHVEFGVRIVVNLEATFFNPRMGPERQRLCRQVQSGEEVCVLFAGCCPEALQFVALTEARRVVAVEINAAAVQCARRSLEHMSKRSPERAARLEVMEGDVHEVVSRLERGAFHRVVAPRPKGKTEEEDDGLAESFLQQIVPLLRVGGVCHWYDFVADWEFPECARSAARISSAVARCGRQCAVLRAAPANNKPVAERQFRTVIDFSVS